MDDLQKYLEKRSNEDAEFKKEWENLQTERQITLALLDARHSMHMSQSELSKVTGIDQGRLSRIETGSANISIKMLDRIAKALNRKVYIALVPTNTTMNK